MKPIDKIENINPTKTMETSDTGEYRNLLVVNCKKNAFFETHLHLLQ